MDSAAEIARAHAQRAALGLGGGQLVGNPIPAASEIPQEVINPFIEQALIEASLQKVSAKAVTPFLLQRLFEVTEGRSLVANIALVLNNARLGAEIANELVALRKETVQ
jgi:pseudouridine-5'-phosphate glycosidase